MPMMKIEAGSNWFDPASQPGKDDNTVVCPQCSCAWMELILVQQYPKHYSIVLGQKPSPKNDIGFWLFRCPKCMEVYEPAVQVGTMDAARKVYDQFIDHMSNPMGTAVDGEDV